VISNGGKVSSFIADIGYNAGSSNNSVLVTGSGSSLSNNSYYGTTVGNAGGGTLTVANGGVAASIDPQGITVASQSGSTGTLNIGGFGTNDAAGTINAPKITFGAGTGTINFNQSNSTTISAVISGHGSVNQLGSGTTILTGNYIPTGNTYSGTTTVSAGTLLASSASGSSALGSSTLMVTNTGTFGGKGVVQGAATIANGGTLAVGLDGVGSLSFNGGLTLEAGSTTIFQVHATDDFTSVFLSGGRVTYGGALVFSLVDFTPVAGDEFEVFNLIGAAESGNFSSVEVGGSDLSDLNGLWSGMNAGVTYQYNVTTGILAVQAVPEPSTYALLVLAVAGWGAHAWRRRKQVS
jgi:T5SS/PEP-CTERM-associated repeat protein/autotransporter-associated beta strand protein